MNSGKYVFAGPVCEERVAGINGTADIHMIVLAVTGNLLLNIPEDVTRVILVISKGKGVAFVDDMLRLISLICPKIKRIALVCLMFPFSDGQLLHLLCIN